ncbi:MAG: M48 family metalloprotease [Candidatus Omnitrophica bacterium]|nr:M48 family metalloprotease [Candidatus Omnitrophota bacterium]MBU0897301.1 M48 family metalloprotease [Candidatus Omnitrophota bacterium]MBU1134144.1 M48 family metalloprotease [Candidatus Omnitrophota bacterium]
MKRFTIVFLAVYFLGCATITGPSVSREEVERATEQLKVKALAFQIEQLQKVSNIGNRLMLAITSEDTKKSPQAFLGIVCASIDKYFEQLYNLRVEKGVVVVVVKENSPAYRAGLQKGDVLLSLNKISISHINHFRRAVSRFKIGDLVRMEITRRDETLIIEEKIGQIPVNVPTIMVDAQEVNAATDGRSIFITYGLLNFVKSDDEIAAVLAHELAHAVRGHVVKRQGWQILGLVAAVTLGIAVESQTPGAGEAVMRGAGEIGDIFNAGYSRDLEREADYFGTKFVYSAGYDPDMCATLHERFAVEIPASMIQNYLSTHPSSPERMLRIKKTIEELKGQN